LTAKAIFLAALAAASPSSGQPVELIFPLDCVLGQTCYIEDYVDLDPGDGHADYRCGLKSRDGHKGTDIGLLSEQQMTQGVNVIAAASGRVRAVRDGLPDRPVTPQNRASIAGQECGNAVAVQHHGGWETRYCHLKNNSLRKKPGDMVQTGDVLGQVGMSGLSNFPHLHLSVSKNGKTIDPFRTEQTQTCSGTKGNGLWYQAPAYSPAGLFAVGFSAQIPSFADVKTGAARQTSLGRYDPALVLYGYAFYAEAGELIHLRVIGPGNLSFEHETQIEKTKNQLFRAFGKRRPKAGWPSGDYRGIVTLWRNKRILAVRQTRLTVAP